MSVKIVYFAWVREKIGLDQEEFQLPSPQITIADLISSLKSRGAPYQDALEHETVIRAAINQEHADHDQMIKDGDEIALFPPMTGG